MQYTRKAQEVDHYRTFLDEKELARMDDDKEKKEMKKKRTMVDTIRNCNLMLNSNSVRKIVDRRD
jgi:hypothetical protein